MNETSENIKSDSTEVPPAMYTGEAILGFSVIFAPVFGGALLRRNFVVTGRAKEGNIAFAISLVLTMITFLLVNSLPTPTGIETIISNVLGGLILSEVIFRRAFENSKSYPRKKIGKPLLISLLIITPMIILAIFQLKQGW